MSVTERRTFLVTVEDMSRAAGGGAFGPNAGWLETLFVGRTFAGLLGGITLVHNAEHIGEALTVRAEGGFGLGV